MNAAIATTATIAIMTVLPIRRRLPDMTGIIAEFVLPLTGYRVNVRVSRNRSRMAVAEDRRVATMLSCELQEAKSRFRFLSLQRLPTGDPRHVGHHRRSGPATQRNPDRGNPHDGRGIRPKSEWARRGSSRPVR